jgi:hypothetical protein
VAVAFITLKSCGGRGCHAPSCQGLIILGLFRFINSCAGSVGNFSMHAERHFLGIRSTSMSRECWHLGQEGPSDTFWSDILWLSGRISNNQERRHFQSAISSRAHASISSRSGAGISRPQAGSSRVLAFHERRHLKAQAFPRVICHVSCRHVRCYVSCLMPHVSCVICRMLCVMCQVS